MAAQNSLSQTVAGWSRLPNSGVRYAETVREPRSPTEELRPDNSRVISTMLVPWNDRQSAARQDLLESASVQVSAGVKFISRVVPRSNSDWFTTTSQRYLFCQEVMRCEGRGMPELTGGAIKQNPYGIGPPEWLLAAMTLLYTSRPYDFVADAVMPTVTISGTPVPDEATCLRNVRITSQGGGSSLPLPVGHGFKFVDGSATVVPGQPSIVIPTDELELTWYNVPKLAIGAQSVNFGLGWASSLFSIDLARGCVNSDTFPAGANGYPPGTLLLQSFVPKPIVGPLGDRIYECVFRMSAKWPNQLYDKASAGTVPVGHNHILDKAGLWRELTAGANAGASNWIGGYSTYTDTIKSPYRGVSFRAMLRPPQG